jgi:outer membrane protein TolC
VHAKWRERRDAVSATNGRIYADNLRDFEDWQRRAETYETARAEHNGAVEQARAAYQSLDADAIADYCELVLSRSKYADLFPMEFELGYRAAGRMLVAEYQPGN